MIKQIVLLSAKAGTPRDAFIKRYEEIHAPLIVRLAPLLKGYRRSYFIPGSMVSLAHIEGVPPEPDFDAVVELRCENYAYREQLEHAFTANASEKTMTEDEEQSFDCSKTRMSFADEYTTSSRVLAPRPVDHQGPPAVVMMAMPRKKSGMSREAFIDRYENGHALLPEKYIVKNGRCLFAMYRRSYPIPGNRTRHLANNETSLDTGIDVMTEISFWTKADYQTFQDVCSDPKIAAIITEDEEQLVDRSALMMFLVETHTSIEF